MFGTLASITIGLVVVLKTVGIAFVIGLALPPMLLASHCRRLGLRVYGCLPPEGDILGLAGSVRRGTGR